MSKKDVAYGFLVHPMDIDDVARKFKVADKMAPRMVQEFIRHMPPFVECKITGVKSRATGREITGALGVVPLLPEQFEDLKDEVLVEKIVQAAKACARQGAKIIGLGALTALPGRGGRAVAEKMRVAVTSGNTYTVAAAIDATKQAATAIGIDLGESTLAIVGAGTQVGRACAILLAPDYGHVLLVGRDRTRLSALKPQVEEAGGADVDVRTDIIHALREAHVVVVAAPGVASFVRAADLRPGAVVCEVTRPRELAASIAATREDVLVIDGGLVRVPGDIDVGVDLGLPPGLALACMAETMILALEERYEDYTLGKEVSIERILEIDALAKKHGFEVAGLRRGEGQLPEDEVERVRALALGGAVV